MSLTLVMQEEKRGESSKKGSRLPLIAPKDDHSSSNSSSRSHSGPSVPPRARLPPRSRTGCWTCRTRKVKCDEGRPNCGQCTRLGHTCDYSPRLSFRDDTPRVVERMQDITIVGSSVWDSNSPAPTETSTGSQPLDDLPPFAQLINDEEREKKAERSSPGTYHVLVNPESFQHLPEYSDESDAKRDRISPLRRGSLATSLASSLGEGIPLANDPNIVVLPKFEDVSRRMTAREPQSPSLVRVKTEDEDKEPQPPGEKDVTSKQDEVEERYWHQFRVVVWKHMVPAEVEQLDGMKKSSAVILEKESESYQPLYHAIMAVAAFSLEEGRLDALQHYQQALSALKNTLKSTEDLSSDGSFWTHFLLLLYEIAAADASVWRQHLSTILRISSLRRDLFGGERYPFALWWICLMDMEAMFSGAGSGEFVGAMLEQEIVPPPSFHLYPLGVDASSVVYGMEFEFLPSVLQVDFQITVLASRVALLSNEARTQDQSGEARQLRLRQSRVYELQEGLRQVWATPAVSFLMQNLDQLSIRPRRLFEHAYLLYRACIIYSHTSMWSTQRLETSPEYDTEIAVASNQILSTANKVLEDGQTDARSMVFPIFIAGYASSDGGQKIMALELIQKMEKDAIGMNTAASSRGLEMVYKKQNERFMMTGQSLDVDWRRVLEEEDLTIVNFGL